MMASDVALQMRTLQTPRREPAGYLFSLCSFVCREVTDFRTHYFDRRTTKSGVGGASPKVTA